MLETLTALAEPNRLRIVELLRAGPQPVGAISDHLQIRQPQVSKHLHLLREAGLVEVTPMAQRRVYGLRPEPFLALHAWLEELRDTWEERFTALDAVIADLNPRPSEGDPP